MILISFITENTPENAILKNGLKTINVLWTVFGIGIMKIIQPGLKLARILGVSIGTSSARDKAATSM